jgi:hypothetical protein
MMAYWIIGVMGRIAEQLFINTPSLDELQQEPPSPGCEPSPERAKNVATVQ